MRRKRRKAGEGEEGRKLSHLTVCQALISPLYSINNENIQFSQETYGVGAIIIIIIPTF